MRKLIYLTTILVMSLFLVQESFCTQVTVYGKGGIVSNPDGSTHICPNQSTAKCAFVELETGTSSAQGTLNHAMLLYEGQKHEVKIISMNLFNDDDGNYATQGITVKFIHDAPINP